jgi:hypothetical protein
VELLAGRGHFVLQAGNAEEAMTAQLWKVERILLRRPSG